jgi:hypothetical protein
VWGIGGAHTSDLTTRPVLCVRVLDGAGGPTMRDTAPLMRPPGPDAELLCLPVRVSDCGKGQVSPASAQSLYSRRYVLYLAVGGTGGTLIGAQKPER